MNTLQTFSYKKRFIADDGGNGAVNNQTGRSAETLVISVPPGTIVYDETKRRQWNGAFPPGKICHPGGPDGGDGGRGGDVVIQVVPTLNTLQTFNYRNRFIADDGGNGAVNNQTGRSADELVISVPPGTIMYDEISGELVVDLVEPGQPIVLVKGGRGGRGNIHFANSRNQAPRTAEKGEPSQERWLRLELKLIADIGIIGVPNAGKSSFLAAVTNAKPKIANYPFTTLEPNLGVAVLDEDHPWCWRISPA